MTLFEYLTCTAAQTGQVLNILHQSGNIHDSNGAPGLIQNCVDQVRKVLPNVIVEVRMDSAFFSDELISLLEACDFFDIRWKPRSWKYKRRFVAVRQSTKIQMKTPVQLDLFIPSDYQWEYKVVITNKILTVKNTVAYHNGRGSQENIFGELKSSLQMDYVPTRIWEGNKVYLLSTVLAHNLTREFKMISSSPVKTTQEKRPTLWKFKALGTLRRQIIQRAGRIIQPLGKLVLSMAKNDAVKDEMLHYLDAIGKAA